jgi:large repetitive protein
MRLLSCAFLSAALFLTLGCSSSDTTTGPTSASSSGAGGGGAGGAGGGGGGVAADPTAFHATGSMKVGRALAAATRLADGRVLVVGGEDQNYAMLASVELYDPKSDTFSDAAPLPEPRDHHTATLLANGQVLVVGGGEGSEISLPDGNGTLDSAVLYDPAANTWKTTGHLHHARAGHRAALLDDGRVLVVGGGDGVGYSCAAIHPNCTIATSVGTAEIYDPKSGTWKDTGSLAQPRLAFSLNVTPEGVVAAGGGADNMGLESVEIYDPAKGTWRGGPSLDGQRLYQSTTVIADTLVVAGGKIANVMPITSVDLLGKQADSWKPGAPLDEARTGASFVTLPSGNALMVAGNDQLGTQFLAEAALYELSTDTWTVIKPLSTGRYSQSTVLLDDGTALVLGGRGAFGTLSSAERSE